MLRSSPSVNTSPCLYSGVCFTFIKQLFCLFVHTFLQSCSTRKLLRHFICKRFQARSDNMCNIDFLVASSLNKSLVYIHNKIMLAHNFLLHRSTEKLSVRVFSWQCYQFLFSMSKCALFAPKRASVGMFTVEPAQPSFPIPLRRRLFLNILFLAMAILSPVP